MICCPVLCVRVVLTGFHYFKKHLPNWSLTHQNGGCLSNICNILLLSESDKCLVHMQQWYAIPTGKIRRVKGDYRPSTSLVLAAQKYTFIVGESFSNNKNKTHCLWIWFASYKEDTPLIVNISYINQIFCLALAFNFYVQLFKTPLFQSISIF